MRRCSARNRPGGWRRRSAATERACPEARTYLSRFPPSHPPASDHVVVVSHRPRPTGWQPEAPYHFATSVEEGMARAPELAAEEEIGVDAGEVGGQALS